MMEAGKERIYAALAADFGAHSAPAADAFEIQPVIARAQFAIAHLEEWMRPTPRDMDPAYHGVMRAFLKSQPKGVVGNIAPTGTSPLKSASAPWSNIIAAGNRFMLKAL